MAMDNMQIRKKQLERLDAFVHELYKETQMFKQYGEDLPDLEGLYLHIHDIISDLLSVQTSQEFFKKVEEFHKGIAGIVVIIGAGDPQQVAEELQKAQSGMSDIDVEDFLKNMQVKEKSAPVKPKEQAPAPEMTEEDREAEKKKLVDTLDLNEQVSTAKPKERNWDKSNEEDNEEPAPTKPSVDEEDDIEPAPTTPADTDPLDRLWSQWKTK